MVTIQSNPSPIEVANTAQRRLFVMSLVFGVLAALIAALLGFLVWKANNKYQEAVKADADGRIAIADSRAAQANAEAAKANEGIGKSNQEIARLTNEAEQARAERAEADKQIEIAKADAAKAKEGTAKAEESSAKAALEIARLQTVVANAEQNRLEAERALLELQHTIKPRTLTEQQRAIFLSTLKKQPGTKVRLGCAIGSEESCVYAQQFLPIFKEAGWTVEGDRLERATISQTFFGVGIFMLGGKKEPTAQPGMYWVQVRPELQPFFAVLVEGFGQLGIETKAIADENFPEHLIGVFFGAKF